MNNKLKRSIIDNYGTLIVSDELPLLILLYKKGDISIELSIKPPNIINNKNITIGSYFKFGFLNYQTISNLRENLLKKGPIEEIQDWCIKIMRYIEIRYSDLRKNENDYGRTKLESIKLYNQILALFIEYFIETNDLIFLNTSLKIIDLKWVHPKPRFQAINDTYILFELNRYFVNKFLKRMEND